MKTPWQSALLILLLSTISTTTKADIYNYDLAGRLTLVSLDNGSTISYSYDVYGNLLNRTVTALAYKKADIDANGSVDALSDGILFLRFLFGFTGNILTDGAASPDATRSTEAITQYLTTVTSSLEFDLDGNGNVDALTDGFLFLRYLFGFRGSALIDGAVAANAQRTTADSISDYIQMLVDTNA